MDGLTGGESHSSYRYRFGSAEFDEARFELQVAGISVDVQRKPLEILKYLLRRAGEVVTKSELLDEVWEGRPTVENVVATALAKLRSALGEENAARIVTQARVGYRLTGHVERIAVGRALCSVLILAPQQPVPGRDHFLLESLIGQSLGSEVWLARHPKTGERRVYKFSRNGEQLAALKREVTLSRVLQEGLGQRDAFVRIIDWNFATAPFFLECGYGGQDLAAWAESERHLELLPLPQRLTIFQQIADAVAAAHSVGVLHKDLKPSNVLIAPGAEGWQVRLTDFGSGRLLEPDRLAALGITQLGMTVTQSVLDGTSEGTPWYLAPEIRAGQPPTAQSDVYALGLLLYQLIIGDLRKSMAPGWDRDVPDELLREDIAAATDGNPAHRLASAAELAERLRALDVRRTERGRQRTAELEARRIAEALQRSRARRPWIIAAFAMLVVGLSISLVSYWRATVARRNAEAAAIQIAAINRFLNDDLLSSADPTGPGRVSDPTMRQVLALATGKIESQLAQAPLAKAAIYNTLGNAYAGLGDYASAEAQLRRAIVLLTTNGIDPELLARSEYGLVGVLIYRSKFQEAKTVLDQADHDAGELLSRPTLLAVQAHSTRGDLDDDQSLEDEALVQYETADQLRQVAAPSDVTLLFKVRLKLTNAYIAARRFTDAEAAARPLLGPEFTVERVGIAQWAKARELVAEVLSNTHNYPVAIQLDREAIQGLRDRLGEKHFFFGFALSELASVYVDSGQPAEALPLMRQCYEITKDVMGVDSQNAVLARANLGILESQLGRANEGIADMVATRTKLATMFGEDNPEKEFVDYYLATSLNQTGRQAEAWSLVSTLSVDSLSRSGEGGLDWQQRIDGLKGQILLRQGRKADAIALLAPAVAKLEADHLQGWIVDPLRDALLRARLSQ
jgi:serine/threonine protein kinase/DNA-binding winged helix-turn-helix (wHTH) protein